MRAGGHAHRRARAALINGTMRDDHDHFKDEMRQLAKQQQNIVGVGSGGTADSPWRLDIEQQARAPRPAPHRRLGLARRALCPLLRQADGCCRGGEPSTPAADSCRIPWIKGGCRIK